ncbi:hypothetical protein FQA47_020016 [Oryzias melastigma]|uniref:Uncharacterized protein n=1 Tax=Oryzias melastigma TaxID=30732 RepID=A0A834FKH9_ORYME|nr:hypothetical protein FQA47_020016 [Oryzias melastigma]
MFIMRNQQTTMCRVSLFERKCVERAGRIRSTLERQLSAGTISSDVWDKTISFFTIKRALILHDGYGKCSRKAMRLIASAAEDVAPLCCQE